MKGRQISARCGTFSPEVHQHGQIQKESDAGTTHVDDCEASQRWITEFLPSTVAQACAFHRIHVTLTLILNDILMHIPGIRSKRSSSSAKLYSIEFEGEAQAYAQRL
jgi:hypothetical protein